MHTGQPYHFFDDYGNPPDTNLPHLASLEWKYTDERAAILIGYIRSHLEKAVFLEVWNKWIGGGRDFTKGIKKSSVYIDELSVADLKKLFSYDTDHEYDCLEVQRSAVAL